MGLVGGFSKLWGSFDRVISASPSRWKAGRCTGVTFPRFENLAVSLTVCAVVLLLMFMMTCGHHQERGRWMYRIDPWCRPSGCPIDARSTVALSREWQVSDKGNFIGLYVKYGLSRFMCGGTWIVACCHQKTRGLLQEMTVTGNRNLDGTAIWNCAEKFTWRSYRKKPWFHIISQGLQYLIVKQQKGVFFYRVTHFYSLKMQVIFFSETPVPFHQIKSVTFL